jgi:Leucine-rich repeat (LRR) protein
MFNTFDPEKKEMLLSGLNNIDFQRVTSAIRLIPQEAVLLDIGWNNLGNRPTVELQSFFSLIHKNVTSIDLRSNNLGKKGGEDAALVFASFLHATHVALSFNNLNSQQNLDKALKGFAQTKVTSLDISSNDLGYLDNKVFQNALAELTSIHSLNLSYNKLAQKNDGEQLEKLCAAFPINLQHINLSNNNLGTKVKHLGKLPENITSLDISDNAIHELSTDDIDEMEGLLAHLTTLYLSYDEVTQMSSTHINKLKLLSSKIDKVIFLDTSGKSIEDKLSPFAIKEPRSSFWSRFKANSNEEHSPESAPIFKK